MKLSAATAIVALPWLKKDLWIPFASSILIDVDHYLWHAIMYRTLSLQAAVRYFGQAQPPQLASARLLHQPIILGLLLILAIRTRSRLLWLILSGLLFHVTLDIFHERKMHQLKRMLSAEAMDKCASCGNNGEVLQLHTLHFAGNLRDSYNPQHFVVLCPACHARAHE
jgi:hypothetical protein